MSATWDGMRAGENALIPPDGPETDLVETESGETLIRETFKDGTSGWRITDRDLTEYEQDQCEEAYEMGLRAAQAQSKLALEMAYGRGVVDAAVTAYGGRQR